MRNLSTKVDKRHQRKFSEKWQLNWKLYQNSDFLKI